MTSKPTKTSPTRGLGRVVAFYVVLAVLLYFGISSSPLIREAMSGARLDELARTDVFGPGAPPAVGAAVERGPWDLAILATLSMFGALAIMVPVTWVYMMTRRRRGYDESVVHTLLILPVAVTGIVMIVQNSVALAFSLAGIVAAVRFRTTLDDTKDAVYVFLAIGVGLACGVQALGISLVLSLVFNGVILVLWVTRFGNIYADAFTRAGPLHRPDITAGPASAATALPVGDPGILDAMEISDITEMAERSVRFERHLLEERKRKKAERANTLIMVHAPAAEPAQRYVESVLERLATRSKLTEMGPGPAGVVLEYIARLDDDGVRATVVDQLREGHDGVIAAAELRSLKGMKPRA